MKYLLKLVAATILVVGSNAMADFDIKDISTAGFHVQSQLASGYAATANTDNHFVDSKTGEDVYPIDIEVNDSSETYVATVLVTINEGEVAQLRCKEGEDLSGLGITCGGTYTVKSSFFADLSKMGFAKANEIANQKHIDAVLNMDNAKQYTIFAGDIYIKVGDVIADVSLSKIKGKTTKQIEELIMESVKDSFLAKSVTSKLQLELKAIAEDAARLSRKAVAEVAKVISAKEFSDNLAAKVEADCVAIGGAFYTSTTHKNSWGCIGGTHPN